MIMRKAFAPLLPVILLLRLLTGAVSIAFTWLHFGITITTAWWARATRQHVWYPVLRLHRWVMGEPTSVTSDFNYGVQPVGIDAVKIPGFGSMPSNVVTEATEFHLSPASKAFLEAGSARAGAVVQSVNPATDKPWTLLEAHGSLPVDDKVALAMSWIMNVNISESATSDHADGA